MQNFIFNQNTYIKLKLLIYIVVIGLLISILPNKAFGEFSLVKKHKGYEIYESERVDGEQSIVILHNNKPIYTITGNLISTEVYDKQDNLLGNNRDILVLKDWTGGAHCCSIYYLVDFTSTDKEVIRINAWDYDLEFVKQELGEPYKIKMNDPVFKYFYACFAESVVPEIILKFNGKEYELDPGTMKHVISQEEYVNRINALERKLSKKHRFVDFIEETINLIYSGNASYAFRMIDELFPKYNFNDLNASEFKEALLCKIKKSMYAESISKMNSPYLQYPIKCEKEKNNPFAF